MEITYWAGTDVGRKRSGNEDNFLIDKRLKLFVVADGMGGHASGEVASAMAVHGIREVIDRERDIFESYDDDDPKSHVEVCTLLEYAVHHTCAEIFHKARLEPEKRGMGTTLVVLLFIGARGFIAYVGDSRIYLLRGGIVYQLTEDHSLRNELIRMGKITADEFETSQYANLKNAMTRAVGVYESVEADTLDFDVIPGDGFLLCSDGLYEYLSDDDIGNAISLPEIREVPGMLIDAANKRGGKDNITAVVVQVAGNDGDHHRAAELNFTLDTLKGVPLFSELSYQQLVRVMNLSKQSALDAGQVLFREGRPGTELHVLLRGRVELTRDEVKVAEIGAGSHLGEMSLIDAAVRSATATALEPGKVLTIQRDDFYNVLRREPALAVKLLWSFVRVLADRLRQTTADLAVARTSTANELLDLTEIAEEAARSAAHLEIVNLEGQSAFDNRQTMVPGTVVARSPSPPAAPGPPQEDHHRLDPRATMISTTTSNVAPPHPEPDGVSVRETLPGEVALPTASIPTASVHTAPVPTVPVAAPQTVVAPAPDRVKTGNTLIPTNAPPTGDTVAPPGAVPRPPQTRPTATTAASPGLPASAPRTTTAPTAAPQVPTPPPSPPAPAPKPRSRRRATMPQMHVPRPIDGTPPAPNPVQSPPENDAPQGPATARRVTAAPQATPATVVAPPPPVPPPPPKNRPKSEPMAAAPPPPPGKPRGSKPPGGKP